MPCNFHLRAVAEKVKEGVRAAGGTPMEFNTIAVSDGVTMGTQGMKASLVSREVIADSIELTVRGYQFDALVAICACDKTIPGSVMALARLDIPSVLLYGGSILPGRYKDRDVTIQDIFEAVGAHAKGEMTDEELTELEDVASPGPGACGGMFTANTMATAYEVMGIAPMGSGMVPAVAEERKTRLRAGRRAGHERAARGPAPEPDRSPGSRSRTRSPRSAMSGGSTNGVLHLLALAREAGIDAHDRRLRPHLRAHAAARRPQARRPLRRPRPERRRRRRPAGRSAWTRPGSCTATRSPSPAAPSARRPTPRPRPRARRSCARSTTR